MCYLAPQFEPIALLPPVGHSTKSPISLFLLVRWSNSEPALYFPSQGDRPGLAGCVRVCKTRKRHATHYHASLAADLRNVICHVLKSSTDQDLGLQPTWQPHPRMHYPTMTKDGNHLTINPVAP
jgi:hypothetical protein